MQEKHLYCVKCHSGRTVVGQSPVILKNGSVALKGKCPSCESMAYKIVSKEAVTRKAEKVSSGPSLGLFAFVAFSAGLALGAVLANFI